MNGVWFNHNVSVAAIEAVGLWEQYVRDRGVVVTSRKQWVQLIFDETEAKREQRSVIRENKILGFSRKRESITKEHSTCGP